jgi:hypothetical protein
MISPRYTFFFLLSCITILPVLADPTVNGDPATLSGEEAYENSTDWPFYVSLTKPVRADGKDLKNGTRGVLIRMKSPHELIVDFGRDGLAVVPVGKTDILERMEAIREGDEKKEFPNFVYQIGPRLIVPTEGRPGFHEFSKLSFHSYFLTVYTSADPLLLDSIAALVNGLKSELESRNVFILFMPVGEKDDFVFSRGLLDHGLEYPFVYGHLAEIYTTSLHHDTSNLPLFVLNDADGKIVLRESGVGDPVIHRFEKALLELEPVPNAPH